MGQFWVPESAVGHKWSNFQPFRLQIWTVHMISGYLHLTNRKDQFGAIWAPFGVMTLFGSIFLPKFFFYLNFFTTQIFFCYPNFFFVPKFFFAQFFFFFFFFFSNNIFIYRWISLTGDIKMMYVACYKIYSTGDMICCMLQHQYYTSLIYTNTISQKRQILSNGCLAKPAAGRRRKNFCVNFADTILPCAR